jgi:hypothetical protein
MFSHLDFPRVMSHANGTPATTSNKETSKAIMKEFVTAMRERFMSDGWLKTVCMVSNLVKIPMIGGSKIKARKIMIAARYMVYFNGFFDDSAFRVSLILRLYSESPLRFCLMHYYCFLFLYLQHQRSPCNLS